MYSKLQSNTLAELLLELKSKSSYNHYIAEVVYDNIWYGINDDTVYQLSKNDITNLMMEQKIISDDTIYKYRYQELFFYKIKNKI